VLLISQYPLSNETEMSRPGVVGTDNMRLRQTQCFSSHALPTMHAETAFDENRSSHPNFNSYIWAGDVLVFDHAITASHNKIVVARLGEDFTVKRLHIIKGSNRLFIKPENPKYQLMEVTRRSDFEVWGVVKTPWFYLSSTALGRKAGAQRTYFLLERGQKATSFDTCNE
jgi:hypothetical protein